MPALSRGSRSKHPFIVHRAVRVQNERRVTSSRALRVCPHVIVDLAFIHTDKLKEMTTTLSSDPFVFERNPETGKIRINVPARYYLVPGVCFTTGFVLGLTRGARHASLRFLAENAHRRPTTVQGWYFYKKTKNYRVMWGGLKGGMAIGLRMAAFGCVWVGLEQGSLMLGERLGEAREMVAGVGSAGLVLAGYRLPRPVWGQVMGLGVLGGGVMYGARRGREWLEAGENREMPRGPTAE
ncbi:unnamed protein product [Rhizoctonia solani]|uniref:Uncharacterized protein n=1 Tax=Rhizoctonia solani TaxID=456999 RepID=A0A8H3AFG6_9AGAM|nr:unnamed protein product [Rhizoctonia solani]